VPAHTHTHAPVLSLRAAINRTFAHTHTHTHTLLPALWLGDYTQVALGNRPSTSEERVWEGERGIEKKRGGERKRGVGGIQFLILVIVYPPNDDAFISNQH